MTSRYLWCDRAGLTGFLGGQEIMLPEQVTL